MISGNSNQDGAPMTTSTQLSEERYLVCMGWMHIFPGEHHEALTRWVLDRETRRVVAAQRSSSRGEWLSIGQANKEDLRDSLVNANDVLASYMDFEVAEQPALPAWAV